MTIAIKRQTVDGKFYYFDKKKEDIVALHPAKSHPMIMRMGDHFILCSSFRNVDGKKINIDFYVVRDGKTFKIVDTLVGQRGPVRRMMSKGIVVRAR